MSGEPVWQVCPYHIHRRQFHSWISLKFYFNIILIQTLYKVPSKFFKNFHVISLKWLKNVLGIISKIRRIFFKFQLHFLIPKIAKKIAKNPLVHSDFFFLKFLKTDVELYQDFFIVFLQFFQIIRNFFQVLQITLKITYNL